MIENSQKVNKMAFLIVMAKSQKISKIGSTFYVVWLLLLVVSIVGALDA